MRDKGAKLIPDQEDIWHLTSPLSIVKSADVYQPSPLIIRKRPARNSNS